MAFMHLRSEAEVPLAEEEGAADVGVEGPRRLGFEHGGKKSLASVAGLVVLAAVAAIVVFSDRTFAASKASVPEECPVYSASSDRMRLTGLAELPIGACAVPAKFCTLAKEDRLLFRDCDGDGIKDPYCESGERLKFGFIGSASNCADNWPSGVCLNANEPGGSNFKDIAVLPAAMNEITIVHFNDVYQLAGVLEGGVRKGGMSRAAFFINEERRRNPDRTFTTFAGDALSPSVLSDLFKGSHMVDVLNEMKLDAASLGNHEFDFGLDVLAKRVNESHFPWLNTNLRETQTNELIAGTTPRLIKMVKWAPRWADPGTEQTLKVCFFGASYDVRESMYRDVQRVKYESIIEASKKEAAYLRKHENCSVVVALTHQMQDDDCIFAKELGTDVDLILGGHDHKTRIDTSCGHAPYMKADSDLKTQISVSLFLNDAGRVSSVEAKMLELGEMDPVDVGIHKKIVEWEERGAAEMSTKTGCLSVDLDARETSVRSAETAIGNFFAEAIAQYHKVDLVVMNGGSIRGDKVYAKGDLTKATLIEMHPFGNTVVKIRIHGKDIKPYLERSLSCIERVCGDFPIVYGFNYTYSPTAPVGSRLSMMTLPNGHPVGDDDEFTMAVTNLMYATYAPFEKMPLYDMVTVSDAVPIILAIYAAVDKASQQGACIAPKIEGRMTVA